MCLQDGVFDKLTVLSILYLHDNLISNITQTAFEKLSALSHLYVVVGMNRGR